MADKILFKNLWCGLTIWIILYISDYSMTIFSAKLYKKNVKDKMEFEGSYELNPVFQKDVNELKIVSKRFILLLILSSLFLSFAWLVTYNSSFIFKQLYEFILGALVLMELTIHMRHFRNFFQFKTAFGNDGIQGKLFYPRTVLLRSSSFEMLLFSLLYLIIFIVTNKYFVLGGSVACLVIANNHRKLLKKYIKNKSRGIS